MEKKHPLENSLYKEEEEDEEENKLWSMGEILVSCLTIIVLLFLFIMLFTVW